MKTALPRDIFGQTSPKARDPCQWHKHHWAPMPPDTVRSLAVIKMNWLQQWVTSSAGPLCHQSYEPLLLLRYNNTDLSLTFSMIAAIVMNYYGQSSQWPWCLDVLLYIFNAQLARGSSSVVFYSNARRRFNAHKTEGQGAPVKWVRRKGTLNTCYSSAVSFPVPSSTLPPLLAWSNNML